MKKRNVGKQILSVMLVIAMVLTLMPMSSYAAVGDLSNVSTGLTGDIDTTDTISLPIKILDYEADGMLFEYAEAYAGVSGVAAAKTAEDFGATWYEDYTTRTTVGGSINTGNYWSDVTLALKTGTYANYTRATWAGNTTANWTGNRAGVVLADFSESSTYTIDQLRYMVVVFRSNVRSGNFTVGINCSNTNGAGSTENYTGNMAVTTENDTYWTYAVLDLKNGSLGSNWSTRGNVYGMYVGLPIDASGEWIDIAHVAYFSDETMATKFGEYALTDGSDRGDNRAFGLLRGSRTQSGGTNYNGIIDDTATVKQLNTYGDTTTVDFSTIDSLGYTLLGTFRKSGIANVGLLESGLSAEGYPVYKEEVVTYVANLLKYSLEITERTSDGWKNYRYVKGTASSIYGGKDLATVLRTKINGNTGSYAAAAGKDLVGTWAEVGGNIASYYDAAYFLLNSIFVSGSYNEPQDDYDYLVLSAGTDKESGDKVYVFDGGFTTSATPASASMAIAYNEIDNTIQNTSAIGKTHFVYEGSNTTTLNPFLPVTDKNNAEGQTISPYYQDDGVLSTATTKDTLVNRNFGFAMISEGEFVYHADDELFFDFEGDDDVYLFINGELVMDIGSAHSIDGVRFELNDYVNAAKAGTLGSDARNKKLALEEGNTYSFKFYYMERHSYGSNIRISTNIHVTDPSMTTTKTAWQDEKQLDFGSIVDKDKIVEYGFAITNNGEENLYNLAFADTDIGVKLDSTNGLTVTGSRVYDTQGGTLEASDLTAIVSHPDYDDITVTFANNDALKAFLQALTNDAVVENGGGLWENSTVLIRGIGYKLSEDQIKAGVFDNTVLTTATNKTKSKKLQGQASMRVFVPADPMYYQWAGHDLEVSKTKLIEDVLAAANQEDNILSGKVPNLTAANVNKIEFVTSAGNTITYADVKMDNSYNLTINYSKTGSNVFYLKVTYNSSKNTVIVPVLVNVTDVENSVYVLDYGLAVDLTENNELFKNDTLTVPGRSTNSGLMAIGTEEPSYALNQITFSAVEGNKIDGNYGDFKLEDSKLSYTPDAFMEGIDTIWTAINVYESDVTPSELGTIDINNEVQMYKSVSTLPATVVYYEDNFPAIKYSAAENTFTQVEDNSGLTQSANQEQNYGQDAAYADNANVEQSGNSLTTITIKKTGQVASFKFKGTGFELIGRTNATDSATLTVKVIDSEENTVKNIPVITEFDNDGDGGDEVIYQVPVVRVTGLDWGTYTVQISGVPARDYDNLDSDENPTIIPTTLYIDGLRIYQPMGATNDNYIEEENGASFNEIRNWIAEGKVAVAAYSDEDGLGISKGTLTWTENRNGDFEGHEVTSVDEYLKYGPNNEVYLEGECSIEALVFYVAEDTSTVHNLQVAVRGIDQGLFTSGNTEGTKAIVKYGIRTSDGTGYTWKYLPEINSSTEQYYTIDYTQCPYNQEKGAYQVVIAVENGMASFSSLKMNGLSIMENEYGEAATLRYVEGVLTAVSEDENGNITTTAVNEEEYPAFMSLRAQMSAETVDESENPEVDEPEVNDPETDEPEVDEPEVDEPEVNEPEVDEPEVDEPEVNDPGTDESGNNESTEGVFGWLFNFVYKLFFK